MSTTVPPPPSNAMLSNLKAWLREQKYVKASTTEIHPTGRVECTVTVDVAGGAQLIVVNLSEMWAKRPGNFYVRFAVRYYRTSDNQLHVCADEECGYEWQVALPDRELPKVWKPEALQGWDYGDLCYTCEHHEKVRREAREIVERMERETAAEASPALGPEVFAARMRRRRKGARWVKTTSFATCAISTSRHTARLSGDSQPNATPL